MKTDPTTITPGDPPSLKDFLDSLTARNASAHTRDAYARDIRDVWACLQQQGVASWQDAQAQHLRLWLAQRHAQGLAARSLSRRLAAVRSLFKHLRQANGGNHGIPSDPCQGLRLPRATRNLPATLESEQLTQLLQPHQDVDSDLDLRDLAMFEVMYGSGLRLSEACQLNLSDIDLSQGEARVTGKGRKTRLVPLGGAAVRALQQWLSIRPRFAHENEPALFLSRQRLRVSGRNVQKRLTLLAQKRGMIGAPHPHTLRHACASHLLQNSGDLRAVQELLGHSNLSTTQIYTHLDFQHLAKSYDAAHPRAQRRKP
ncbi:MAG: tyrosine recombinase XerC [Pseudomonadota bacterium]